MTKSSKSDNKKPTELRSYILRYLVVFTLIILVLLWVFQYFFISIYYKSAKINQLNSTADVLQGSMDDGQFRETVKMLAFTNNLCIVVSDERSNILYKENTLGSFSYFNEAITNNWGTELYQLISALQNSNDDVLIVPHKNSINDSEELLYVTTKATPKGTLYLFMETSLDPMNSTSKIMRDQLLYITVIIFELAFIISIFISRRISRPIVNVTKTANKFAEGDFDVEFAGKGYLEVEELSDVLNKAKDEISKVSKLKEDLVANISHDLRTPLTMVVAYAEMIRDLSGDNPKKRNEHLQVIIDEANRLTALVNSILEVSKLQSGNIEIVKIPVSVHSKMQEVMSRYQHLNEREGYDIKFIPDDDIEIFADPDKLDQVFYNFINNAVNYSSEDKRIRIKQTNKQDVVRFEIIDHGKGISKEKLPKVFERYYRDERYKRDVTGTGLGLSIVKEILKKHGFAFGVVSEENKGTTFWFEADIYRKELLLTQEVEPKTKN